MVRLKIIQREGDKYTLTNDAFKKIRNEMKKEREYEKLKSNVNRDEVLCGNKRSGKPNVQENPYGGNPDRKTNQHKPLRGNERSGMPKK